MLFPRHWNREIVFYAYWNITVESQNGIHLHLNVNKTDVREINYVSRKY